MLWAFVPIVAPADDEVATMQRMAVIAEIPALKFKFDADALPSFGTNLPLGVAVRKSLLNGFDQKAQLFREHSKEENHALFVHRFVTQRVEVCGIAVHGATSERRVLRFVRRSGGSGVPLSFRSSVWLGNGKERHDIGPSPLALGKLAKNFR